MWRIQFYKTSSIYSSLSQSDDHFCFVYADQSVGIIAQMVPGGFDNGKWNWTITIAHQGKYDPSWGGWADTVEEGKAAFAKRFREWINQYGDLQPIPEWSRFNVKYVSELVDRGKM